MRGTFCWPATERTAFYCNGSWRMWGWKSEIYCRYSSQDTWSCHYKSEPSLGGVPKGPTWSFKTRLSFSARDNVTLFSIKAALWKITVSPLNPIGRLWFVYQGCAAFRIELRMPFKFQGRKPTWCRILIQIWI